MKNSNSLMRNRLSLISVLTLVILLSGSYLYNQHCVRKYSSGIKKVVKEKDGDQDALGMIQYFFNARKNITTGQMDYGAMAAANMAANAAMSASSHSTARTMGSSVTNMTWTTLGPSNIGGRTRAILIDTINDPSHNTLYAAAVSGGIWKSINAGATWDSVPGNDQLSSMEACDIAEDKNGVLYVGTGEGFSLYEFGDGFSTAMIGGGIFKSTNKGLSFSVIPSTVPNPSNNPSIAWAYVNRIAIDPTNPLYIYAATNLGLYGSNNGGNSWTLLKNQSNATLDGNSLDVKISADDKILVAFTGTPVIQEGYYAYPNGNFVTTLTNFHTSGGGKLPASGSRIEFAISPSNSNYVYASDIITGDAFGPGASTGTGVYMNMTALTNGGHWYDIGPGGTGAFDPYSSGGSQDQASYDNTMAVDPRSPGHVLVGGTILWAWQQQSATDTIGVWTNLTSYDEGNHTPPDNHIHPDEHAITYDLANPNIIYDGNDGGIYKSYDGGNTWAPENRNYDVTQFVDISFAPFVSPLPNPAGKFTEGEGVMGGTQDNGTPYISGNNYYYEDANSVDGGDGGRTAISQLNPNIYYTTADNDALSVGGALSALGAEGDAYTKTQGALRGADIEDVSAQGGCFYNQIALYENPYDTTTLNRMNWIADSTYPPGKVLDILSPNSGYPFPYKLIDSVHKGDTINIVNPVISKIAVGFTGNTGVWIEMQAINLSIAPIWMPIGGPLSKPDAFTGGPVHCLAWSPNGDALFVGTEAGQLFRFSNLDSIQDTAYSTGALYGTTPTTNRVDTNFHCKVISTNITTFGQDILSISIDPKNGNNMIVTLGNYGSNPSWVYYSNNALGACTLTACQGSGPTALPPMPVYSSLLDVLNSGQPNSALVGTEKGIYSTTDITVPSPTWVYTNSGMANTLVMALKQQTMLSWQCNNDCDVYVGTHGRGAFVSSTFYLPAGIAPVTDATLVSNDLKVYPNPMTSQGTLEFNLPQSTDVMVTVYDLSGRVVKTIPMQNQAPGQHLVTLNTQDLTMGTYIANVTGNNFQRSARFIVVK